MGPTTPEATTPVQPIAEVKPAVAATADTSWADSHRPPADVTPLPGAFTRQEAENLSAGIAPSTPPETGSILGDAIHSADTVPDVEPFDPTRLKSKDPYDEIMTNGELTNWSRAFADKKKGEAAAAERIAKDIDGLATLGQDPKFIIARELGIISANPIDQNAFNQKLDALVKKNLDEITHASQGIPEATAQVELNSAIHTANTMPDITASISAATETVASGPAAHVPTAEAITSSVTAATMPEQLAKIDSAVNAQTTAINNQIPAPTPVAPVPTPTATAA